MIKADRAEQLATELILWLGQTTILCLELLLGFLDMKEENESSFVALVFEEPFYLLRVLWQLKLGAGISHTNLPGWLRNRHNWVQVEGDGAVPYRWLPAGDDRLAGEQEHKVVGKAVLADSRSGSKISMLRTAHSNTLDIP